MPTDYNGWLTVLQIVYVPVIVGGGGCVLVSWGVRWLAGVGRGL